MAASRVLCRVPKTLLAQCRTSVIPCSRSQQHFSVLSNHLRSLHQSIEKVPCLPQLAGGQIPLLNRWSLNSSVFQKFGLSSSASQRSEKDQGSTVEDSDPSKAKASRGSKHPDRTNAEVSDQAKESDSEEELSMDELVKLVAEKKVLLKSKQEEIENMKDKVLRTFAEMENVMDRTKREAENSKKFAIQSFAKGLLDVADTLERASSVVRDSFAKIDASSDTAGAVPLLKTLLEGVEMTDKQLAEVFRKFGVEKFNPTDEQFDPHRHNAVYQVPDGSKPPGTVAAVLKPGYSLYDRVIRPAQVGVTKEEGTDEAN